MHIFSAKLDDTRKTIELVLAKDAAPLSIALSDSLTNPVVAVGSGGSAISAEYLSLCRATLGAAPTLVQTPMEFVLAYGSLIDTDVFLFSAGGNNPDILAAQGAAIARGAHSLHVVTNNDAGQLAKACFDLDCAKIYVLPSAVLKDGFLATHSLVGTVTALLMASNIVANGDPSATVAQHLLTATDGVFAADSRRTMAECFASSRPTDTILLLEDPRLSTVGLLIETSIWETALCNIQRTDHRNFAHGRHVWLQHRPHEAVIVSLVGPESFKVWKAIEKSVPGEVRRFCLEVKNCGRLENAIGVLSALTIVEALGKAISIDPANPGMGSFAKNMYDCQSLLDVANILPPAVRHKRAAMATADLPNAGRLALIEDFEALKIRLRGATFHGLVLDYDGTVVAMAHRYHAPTKPVVGEIERLINEGMRIAFATGRGGSAGEKLREALPLKFHPDILVGYYNGAYTRRLDVDIRKSPVPPSAAILEVEKWLDESGDLFFADRKMRMSPVQITIELASIRNLGELQRRFASRFGTSPEIRMTKSGHSVDICLYSGCKTNVFKELALVAGISSDSILCIGDSGDALGNDYALLGMPFGLSVDRVCCRADSGWALHGATTTGPDALLHILKALRPQRTGGFKIDVDAVEKRSHDQRESGTYTERL